MNGHDIEKELRVWNEWTDIEKELLIRNEQEQDITAITPCRHIGRFFFCTKAGIQGSQTSYPTRFSGGPVGACAEDWEKEYR
ncbi:hypothetical protein [Paenibacillus cellulositrophicus]|uniref:hypothetical protein n=1 Tax=Paenibacillus cellulositrophicus TaxID=562959 RepID=UPI003D995EA1